MRTPPPGRQAKGCSCGGCLTLLLVLALAVLLGGGLIYHAATTPYLSLPAVATNDASANSAAQNLALVQAASARAKGTGKPVTVSITLTDSEMTSLVVQPVNLAEQSGALPRIDDVVVHAEGAGTLQVQAHLHTPFGTLPLYASIRLSSPDHKSIDVSVTEARLGTIPLPAGLLDGVIGQVREQVARIVSANQTPAFDRVSLAVAPGQLTVTATAEP